MRLDRYTIRTSLEPVRPMPRLHFIAVPLLAMLPRLAFGQVQTTPQQELGGLALDAAFVSQSVPAFIELFAPTRVSVTMRNTGTSTWVRSDGDIFLASARPQDNYFWCIQDNPHGMYSGNRVLLPADVAPGVTVTFDFVVKPLACGFAATAPFRFRMLSQSKGTFGEETEDPGTHVSAAAEFVSQQTPMIVPASASIPVNVVFRNLTLSTWHAADGYALVPASPSGSVTWGVNSVPLAADVAPNGLATFAFRVTMPKTPGTYGFQWQLKNATGAFGPLSPATSITVVDAGPPNYQGLWWAAPAGSEAGWGISVAHQGNTIFATWFTYDASGQPLWLSMTAGLGLEGQYSGALVQTSGPAFDSGRFSSNPVPGRGVGTGTLTFAKDGTGTFAYTVNGIAQTKKIVPQQFGPLPTCTFALTTDLTSAYNYQDMWWASPAGSQSGWGIDLAHQGDVIFATWFTYDRDGSPLWLAVTATKTPTGSYAGRLYRTIGPPFDAVPFRPADVVATSVGTAELAFSNGNAGTFTWTIDGVTSAIPITRQIFESPGTTCQ